MNVDFYKNVFFSSGIMEAGWVPPNERAGGRSTTRTPDDPDMLYHAFKTILNATKTHQVFYLFNKYFAETKNNVTIYHVWNLINYYAECFPNVLGQIKYKMHYTYVGEVAWPSQKP